MLHVQVRTYQRDIGILSQQLSDIKNKFLQQKRRERLEDQAGRDPALQLGKMDGLHREESQLAIKAVRISTA